jgi:hypothetical protein
MDHLIERIKDRLVDDWRDVGKWWSTWLSVAVGLIGAVSVGLQAMPQPFQDCVSASFPKWVVIAMSAIAFLVPIVRVIRQSKNDTGT